MENILAGYDGSPSARYAVAFAVDLAKRFDARLHVLVVARAPDWGAIELERKEMVDYELRHANEVLDDIKAKLTSSNDHAEFDLVIGQPAKEIVLYAEQHGIDHLVVTGMQSEYCVDSAIRGAYERGYKVTLVSDAHSTFDSKAAKATDSSTP